MEKRFNELGLIVHDYDAVNEFIENHKKISLVEFNYYSVNELSLFFVRDKFDFDEVNEVITKFENSLPAIKRIFAKPIIHLIELDEVLPVENVRLINNKTINHIATHSELWSDYDKNGIKPKKLLTRSYQDNYSIYENILFAKTIDVILDYLRKNMRALKNLMYTCKIIEFNLLERTNHWDYFLALGKLHIGYVKDFGKNYIEAKNIYNRMDNIYDILTARLKRNVYRLNHKKTKGLELHNSNILHMHKDYHKIYVLYKNFKKNGFDEEDDITEDEIKQFHQNYFSYLKLLLLFSIQHFNFICDEKKKISLDTLNMDFEYKKWHLHTETTKNNNAIILTITKDKTYKIAMVPAFYRGTIVKSDEIVYFTPFAGTKIGQYVNINDVESFRRIQRILQKGMIYSDSTFDTCLFCGDSLKNISLDEEYDEYLCSNCHMHIIEKQCSITKENYYLSTIYNYKPDNNIFDDTSSLYHYRNITDVTKDGQFICPKCKKIH